MKELDVNMLYSLLTGYTHDDYELISDTIYDSDPEDGGAEHEYVIKELSTGKHYKGGYSDWDIDNTDWDEETQTCFGRVDLGNILIEVAPHTETTTVYK